MVSADGDDRCQDCWLKHLKQYKDDAELQEIIKASALPLAEMNVAQTKRCAEGWIVMCEGAAGEKCGNEVFVSTEDAV